MDPRKRALDLAIAVPLSIAVVPVVAVVAMINLFTGDRGPVLYRAARVGATGRTFLALKLRTMRIGDEGAPLTSKSDPRITRVGAILRDLKLDELPQVWNVVRGDMSLVGPRPEDPIFVDWNDPLHRLVFSQRPGITGLAQVAFWDEAALHDPDDPVGSYRAWILPRKLAIDRRYVETRSLRLDARILLTTAGTVVRRTVGLATRYAGRR